MKILSLDPSSTVTGYASGTGYRELADAGIIKPISCCAGAVERMQRMQPTLKDIIGYTKADLIIIEIPSGKTHARIGNASGLATYGMAVGVMLAICWDSGAPVETISANLWTRGSKKRHRQLSVKADFPKYNSKRDPGMDAADAICMMQWWFTEQRKTEAQHERV